MKTLDDLKREVWEFVDPDKYVVIGKTIDYLHAQGRILPDGWVAVPIVPNGYAICEMIASFNIHDAPSTAMVSVYKAMIAAAPCPTTGTQAFIDQCNRTAVQKVGE